jgi:hypothetical protein
MTCTAIGMIISLMGSLILLGGFDAANLQVFIALYVVGNVIALCATGFLCGPRVQCKKMWDPTRRYTTAFYLSTLIVVFACAVTKQNILLILALLFVSYCASIWYSASYIPFGRKIILACLKRTICKPCADASEASAKK